MNNNELWQAALGELELSLSKANFVTWFKGTFISSWENAQVIIGVPHTFTKIWLEKKYHENIVKTLQKLTENQIKTVTYKVEMMPAAQSNDFFASTKISQPAIAAKRISEDGRENQPAPILNKPKKTINEHGLDIKYTFEHFIAGKGNELAYAAATAVCENPGSTYNPLFIYGGVGLGKTHLMHAVAHELLDRDKKILYVTCEKFTNDYIQSVRQGKAKEFKDLYRNVDLLLVDDVQFMAAKEGTQEEFFHTFNALHQFNKQIVLSSDRPPKAIPALEQRLLSRFEWGMIADITQPDLETRIAILEQKCKEKNYPLTKEIIQYVATNVQNNIRELEGALNRIIAHHQFKNIPVSIESTKALLSSITAQPLRQAISAKDVISAVSNYFNLSSQDLLGKSREQRIALPRQMIMYLLREELNFSFPSIGVELGGRDHTTAMHACSKINKELDNNNKLKQDLDLIKERLYN